MNRHVLLWFVLLFFIGFAGLSNEILYIRLLSIFTGEVFYASAVVVGAVFAGLAIGYWYIDLWPQKPWLYELGIALISLTYAVIIMIFGVVPLMVMVHTLPFFVGLILSCLLITLPMVLVGVAIPLLYRMLPQATGGFSSIYLWYHLGAGFGVVLIELFFLQHLSLQLVIIVIALGNVGIALILYVLQKKSLLTTSEETVQNKSHNHTSKKYWITLFGVSLVSGVAYTYLFDLAARVFGPTTYTYSFVIALTIIALSVAARRIKRAEYTSQFFFQGALTIGLVGVLLSIWIDAWGLIVKIFSLVENTTTQAVWQLALLSVCIVPFQMVLGATVPAWIKCKHGSVRATLTVVSVGNALGVAFGYVFAVYIFNSPLIILAVAASAYIMGVMCSDGAVKKRTYTLYAIVTVVLLAYTVLWWPGERLVLGYKQFYREENTSIIDSVETYVVPGGESHIVNLTSGIQRVVHGGHATLNFRTDSPSQRWQSMLGVVSSLYHDTKDSKALFVGLGTGTSVGAASTVYDQVVVYEINPSMIQLAASFKEANYGVLEAGNVDIRIQDGIVGIAQQNTSYSAVVNITTRPLYYSANKIHSLEFLKLAKRSLSHDGVYVGWFDSYSGIHGLEVYNNTLHQVFKECHYYYFNDGYFAYACGDNLQNPTLNRGNNDQVNEYLQDLIKVRFDIDTPRTDKVNSVLAPELVKIDTMGLIETNAQSFTQYTHEKIFDYLRSVDPHEREQICDAVSRVAGNRQIGICNTQ